LPPREETRAARPAEPQPIQAARPAGTRSLLVDEPVRSGQSVIFPEGDVTVVGSVASGAEVIAGGSIHIYGTLRGRAIAGSNGNADARIFCGKLEAELVAIDGLYRMAEDMGSEFRGRAVQTWLEGDAIKMAALV
jgi:septum site-determining protein MinC